MTDNDKLKEFMEGKRVTLVGINLHEVNNTTLSNYLHEYRSVRKLKASFEKHQTIASEFMMQNRVVIEEVRVMRELLINISTLMDSDCNLTTFRYHKLRKKYIIQIEKLLR